VFGRFAPETCNGPCGSSAPDRTPGRDSALLARQYKTLGGYDAPPRWATRAFSVLAR